MQRIRQRKFGRDGNTPHALQATHVIKIGFNKRDTDHKPGKLPGKLRGFLLCRDGIDEAGQLVVDMECMSKYGVAKEAIAKAKQLELKAPVGLLPAELHFVLVHDARKEEGRWVYPGTFGEEYELWGKMGRNCHGDGVTASRRQEDGTRTIIECVPRSKEGAPAISWCPYSVDGTCKAKSRLVLCLWKEDKPGRPMPVSDVFGWEARFRFDTTSEYNPIGFLQVLDAAAERLHGNIAGIPGMLVFEVKPRRTANESAPVGVVGSVTMTLSNAEIDKREREQWDRQIEERKSYALSSGRQLLPEHEAPAAEREPEEDDIVMDDDDNRASPFVEVDDPEPPADVPAEVVADDKPPPPDLDLREQVFRAHEILIRDFPDAANPLSFELNSEWGVTQVQDVPEEYAADVLALLRNLYREERKGKGHGGP